MVFSRLQISKFYFYLSEPARAVAQLNRHVSRFHTLSTGWQIGQETFEFWSWLSKQYRLFGDLVSIALRSGCHLPSLRPPPLPRVPPLGAGAGLAGPSPGLVPVNILQHPGHYYHLAGLCAVERRDRFREMTRVRAQSDGKEPAGGQANPAYAHEAKVEHSEIIIEASLAGPGVRGAGGRLLTWPSAALHEGVRVLQGPPGEEHDLHDRAPDRPRPPRSEQARRCTQVSHTHVEYVVHPFSDVAGSTDSSTGS